MSNPNQPKKSSQFTNSPPPPFHTNNGKSNISPGPVNMSSPRRGGGPSTMTSSNPTPSPFGSPPPTTSLSSIIEYESILQCMIYDYMRRRGYLQAADFLLSEANLPNEQQISWLAERLMIANRSVYQAASKSGFLAYWWGTFLDLYTQRNSMSLNDLLSVKKNIGLSTSTGASSGGIMMGVSGNNASIPSPSSSNIQSMTGSIMPTPVMPQTHRLPEDIKHILFSIMKSLNISHMNPAKMNEGERQAFAAALSRIGLDHLITPLCNGIISLYGSPSLSSSSMSYLSLSPGSGIGAGAGSGNTSASSSIGSVSNGSFIESSLGLGLGLGLASGTAASATNIMGTGNLGNLTSLPHKRRPDLMMDIYSQSSNSTLIPLDSPPPSSTLQNMTTMTTFLKREKQIIPKPTSSSSSSIGNNSSSSNISNSNSGSSNLAIMEANTLHMPDPATLTPESFFPSTSLMTENDNLSLPSPSIELEDPSAYFITDPLPDLEVQILLPIKSYTHHDGKSISCSIVYDGSLIASSGSDHKIRVHEIETGSLIASFDEAHSGLISQIRFAPKKRLLASASFDKTIKIWDMNTTSPIMTLIGHNSSLSSIAFDPYNPDRLCSCDTDGNFLIWNLQTGSISSRISINSDPTSGIMQRPIRFQADKRSIIAIADGMDLVIYNVNTGHVILTIKTNIDKPIIAISWGLRELNHIVAISSIETVLIYRLDIMSESNPSSELMGAFNFTGDKIGSISFLPPKPALSRTTSITSVMSSHSSSAITGTGQMLVSSSSSGTGMTIGGASATTTGGSGGNSSSGGGSGGLVWEAILLVGTYRLITPLRFRTDSTKITRGTVLEAAHEGLVSSLALYINDNILMIGSTGHDGSVKTWKVVD